MRNRALALHSGVPPIVSVTKNVFIQLYSNTKCLSTTGDQLYLYGANEIIEIVDFNLKIKYSRT